MPFLYLRFWPKTAFRFCHLRDKIRIEKQTFGVQRRFVYFLTKVIPYLSEPFNEIKRGLYIKFLSMYLEFIWNCLFPKSKTTALQSTGSKTPHGSAYSSTKSFHEMQRNNSRWQTLHHLSPEVDSDFMEGFFKSQFMTERYLF